jgi:Zn-dependent M16 (insulinase) family peptidase
LKVYEHTSDFLRQLELSDGELSKSIISTIGDLDAYQLPDAKGYASLMRYLTGVDDDQRQRLRNEVLTTNQEDFHALAGFVEQADQRGQVVVLGSADSITSASAELPGGMEVRKVT